MTARRIKTRLKILELRKGNVARTMHLIKAVDSADSDRQIVELMAAGKVGPRDGFLSLTGWTRG
jgi:hypothetical protein